MPATVSVSESNGAGQTITASITNGNMGSVDAVNLDTIVYPVIPGNRTFAKYQRINLSDISTSSAILNLKIWRTSALGGAATHVTNARTAAYGGAIAYVQPVATSIATVDQAMPTSAPATANLGIAGALAGILTANGYSDYLVHQIVTAVADVTGSTSTMSYQYDEVA